MAKTTSKTIRVLGPSYEEKSKNLNAQRTINLYPHTSVEGKEGQNVSLYPTPGSKVYQQALDLTNPYQPVGYNGPLFTDTAFLYTLSTTYDATGANYVLKQISDRAGIGVAAIGSTFVVGVGSLSSLISSYDTAYNGATAHKMRSNSINTTTAQGESIAQDFFNLVVLIPPSTADASYVNFVYAFDKGNTLANGIGMWEPNVKRPTSIAYLDGYFFINNIDSWTAGLERTKIYASELAPNLNTVWWTDLRFAAMYYKPDCCVKLIGLGAYLYAFGLTHYEIWYNDGNQDFPFSPIKEATQEVGLAVGTSICSFGGSIYFAGRKGESSLGIYQITGLEMKKISTPAIDTLLSERLTVPYSFASDNYTSVYYNKQYNGCYGYEHDGHVFIVFNLGNATDPGNTSIVYDVTTGVWHERAQHLNGVRYSTHMEGIAALGKTYVRNPYGDLLELDEGTYTDWLRDPANIANVTASPITRQRVTQHLSGQDSYLFHRRFRLDMDTVSNTFDANVTLESSDDDGKTWFNHGTRTFANTLARPLTGDARVEWFGLGRSEDRIYRLTSNTNTNIYFTGAFADIEAGYR